MGLRQQLLLVSLLLLTLPWAGCQFVREVEGALRSGQEQSLQATAQAIAAVLGGNAQTIYPFPDRRNAIPDDRASIYAYYTQQPVIVDGYGDGWEDIPRSSMTSAAAPNFSASYAAQVRGDDLYLLFQVSDDNLVYDNPGLSPEPNGDRLVLRLWYDNRRQDYVITTAAPGSVRARPGNRRERNLDPSRVRGYWQDAVGGYNLELELPLEYTGGRLGFYFVNETGGSGNTPITLGNIKPLEPTAPPWLIYTPPTIHNLLKPFDSSLSQIQLIDNEGWLLAEQRSSLPPAGATTETFWLLRWMYRSILRNETLPPSPAAALAGKVAGVEIEQALAGNPDNRRYSESERSSRTTLVAAAPIRDSKGILGAVVVRQSAETYLSLTDKAFSRLFGYSLIALGIGAIGLLGYATLLSWRIRKLSSAARDAIDDDGRVVGSFSHSGAADEIGELSRQYGGLLEQVRQYNDYLRTLSGKLSHELRTPIAVIQSSLDNLEDTTRKEALATAEEQNRNDYVHRAREGLARLQKILTSMSEANRLEESIRGNQLERIDLAPFLQEVFNAYRDVYQKNRLILALEHTAATTMGAPDLLVQSLDKLMDNAASFCPPEGEITLQLQEEDEHWLIRITNQGPALPTTTRDSLLQPMISVREKQTEHVHLGLGLHIVQLVAQFHRGKVDMDNLADSSGVVVTLALPILPEEAND
ncbi:MAG: ATP-binding protein [Halioglobus sp.]